jgi:hypothetical protein
MLTIIVPIVCMQSVVALCQMLNKVANDGSGTNMSATKLVSLLKFFLHWQSLKIFAINVTVIDIYGNSPVFLVKQVPGRGPEQRESG